MTYKGIKIIIEKLFLVFALKKIKVKEVPDFYSIICEKDNFYFKTKIYKLHELGIGTGKQVILNINEEDFDEEELKNLYKKKKTHNMVEFEFIKDTSQINRSQRDFNQEIISLILSSMTI